MTWDGQFRRSTDPQCREQDKEQSNSLLNPLTTPDLNHSLKLSIQGVNEAIKQIRVEETEEMAELADRLTPILKDYRTKIVMISLAFLLSEQLDMIELEQQNKQNKQKKES
jgi:hypothetical protein